MFGYSVFNIEKTTSPERRAKKPILLKRKNSEITLFRNAEFIPAYYFIPKSILERSGTELNSIPRNPKKLLCDWNRYRNR